jgi:hypothetical protein
MDRVSGAMDLLGPIGEKVETTTNKTTFLNQQVILY